jgi:hypothetical protein
MQIKITKKRKKFYVRIIGKIYHSNIFFIFGIYLNLG